MQRGGVTLLARHDAAKCLQRNSDEGCLFFGNDSFIVSGSNIQPVGELSPDWSGHQPPPVSELLSQISAHPAEITHYEFVFKSQ